MAEVSVADDTVSAQGEKEDIGDGQVLWGGDPTFLIAAKLLESRQVLDAVAGAVAAAGARFYRVDFDTGNELSADELLPPYGGYTPN